MAQILNGDSGFSVRIKLNNTGIRKNTFDATIAPTINNDTDSGYEIGSLFFVPSTGQVFISTDVSSGAATWTKVGGGATATGDGGDQVFLTNGNTVTSSYTIDSNFNAISAGPVTINSDVTVTIPTGSRYVVV